MVNPPPEVAAGGGGPPSSSSQSTPSLPAMLMRASLSSGSWLSVALSSNLLNSSHLACSASCQARAAHSRARVFPDPVGDSCSHQDKSDVIIRSVSWVSSYQQRVLTTLEAGDDPAGHGHLAGVGLHGELDPHTAHKVLPGSHCLSTGSTSHHLKLLTV